MHELAITQGILETALKTAKENGAKKIIKINLVIGDMSGVVEDSVVFCFELLSQQNAAKGALLNFSRRHNQMHCRPCGHIFSPKPFEAECPECHAWDVDIVSGNEFYIDSIEVD